MSIYSFLLTDISICPVIIGSVSNHGYSFSSIPTQVNGKEGILNLVLFLFALCHGLDFEYSLKVPCLGPSLGLSGDKGKTLKG